MRTIGNHGHPWPHLDTSFRSLNLAWQAAVGDVVGNILPRREGLLTSERPVLTAGLVYPDPWTRDAAINTWNGLDLLQPELMKGTLLSVLETDDDGLVLIGGQYWDAVIWAVGAEALWRATRDNAFARLAVEAVRNTLEERDRSEYDAERGLYRGGSCFMDGISAYSDHHVIANRHEPGIRAWPLSPEAVYEGRSPVSRGFPACCLSTNLLYREAFRVLQRLAPAVGLPGDPAWADREQDLNRALHRSFEREDGGWNYLIDPEGASEQQEGMGIAFALLFDVLPPDRARALAARVETGPHGIQALWPGHERYRLGEDGFGRHCGVWPQVNALWAEAALRHGRPEAFDLELRSLAEKAHRDGQFAEIYHPVNGHACGGFQENGPDAPLDKEWFVGRRQTWCATGLMRMVLKGMLGLRVDDAGQLHWSPYLPESVDHLHIEGIPWNGGHLAFDLKGRGHLTAPQPGPLEIEPGEERTFEARG